MSAFRGLAVVVFAGALFLAGAGCSDGVTAAPESGLATAALNGSTWLAPDADLTVPPAGWLRFDVLFEHHGSESGVEVREIWDATAEPPLFAGASATIAVGARRFPRCGISGQVFAALRFDDGTELDLPLTGGDEASGQRTGTFTIPADAAGPLEIWLWSDRGDGCIEYDSNFGANHRFEVFAWTPTVATFAADGRESVDGPLVAGTALVVDYDIARLPNCRVNYRGFPNWRVTAYARFDDGPVMAQQVVSFGNGGPYGTLDGSWTVMRPVFPVPGDAEHVALWFENTQYPPTCQDWDSDGGQNYGFAIDAEGPAVPLGPALDPAVAQGAPVKLARASIVVTPHPEPYIMTTTLVGDVLVADLAFDKQVTVHVQTVGQPLDAAAQGGAWFDVPASYVGAVGAGYERWRFEVPTALYKGGQGSSPLFRYAVRYAAAGQEYWDNHGGDDYRDAYLGAPVQLATSTYTLESHPSLYTMTHVLSGQILVENLGFHKDVALLYVGADGGWHEAAATYSAPSYTHGNYEVWTFRIAEAVYKVPPAGFFRFAIRYRVDGAESWDNNGGADYDGTVDSAR